MSINCWVKVVGPVHYNHLICVVCKLTIETQNTSISMCIVTAIESKLITLRNSLRIQVSIDIYMYVCRIQYMYCMLFHSFPHFSLSFPSSSSSSSLFLLNCISFVCIMSFHSCFIVLVWIVSLFLL